MAAPLRYDFASDNTAGICPQAFEALVAANRGAAPSYGADQWTAEVSARVREIFETDCDTFIVFNGTGANSLGLAHLCHPFDSVICHERAHIETDECGAPEFFSGGAKLLGISGPNGKIDLKNAETVLGQHLDVHSTRVRVLSVTQSTEAGTVYSPDELHAVAAFAKRNSLHLHMDGARFANAVGSLGCRPSQITWQAGVDLLSFGGTKNGLAAGELVIFFKRDLAEAFEYRVKQGAQLASKMRFLAAPWLALLTDDLWLKNARHANEMTALLETELRARGFAKLAFPREANALFVRWPDEIVHRMHETGWRFQNFFDAFVADLRA
jgi:threonine aldolase